MSRYTETSNSEHPNKGKDFAGLVLLAQDEWRQNYPGFREVSSSVEVPQLAEWSMAFARRNFPRYVPPELRRKVFETHPLPLVSVGVLEDKRSDITKDSKFGYYTRTPVGMGEKYTPQWQEGICIFFEIAADTLYQDMFAVEAHRRGKLFRPVNRIGQGYKKAYSELKHLFWKNEIPELLDVFRKELVVACLSRKENKLDTISRKLGFKDFDWLVCHIGGKDNYSKDHNRFVNSLLVRGYYGPTPGIINLIGLRRIVEIAALVGVSASALLLDPSAYLVSGAAVISSVRGIPGFIRDTQEILMHEISHYLLSGFKHEGMLCIEWELD
jgi:hypothetical protein